MMDMFVKEAFAKSSCSKDSFQKLCVISNLLSANCELSCREANNNKVNSENFTA
jgi:hypothetical protein